MMKGRRIIRSKIAPKCIYEIKCHVDHVGAIHLTSHIEKFVLKIGTSRLKKYIFIKMLIGYGKLSGFSRKGPRSVQ